MKRLFLLSLLLLAITASAWAQGTGSFPPGGLGGTSSIACVGTPGNTPGAYRQQCQTSGGALYACNNSGGCAVAGDWVAAAGAGTVTGITASGPAWLTWVIADPTTAPAITLSATTGQTSGRVIGTCGSATTFGPCALVDGDIPSTMTGKTIDGVTPTAMGFVDATSSIQTQINTKVTQNGALGTPSSGTATNLTGLPAAALVAGALANGMTATTQPCSTSNGTLATTGSLGCVAGALFQAVAVQAATVTVLPNTPTYSNGTAGVGATLTAGSNGALTIDGYTVLLNDRVLVNNQANALQNGVYTQTTLGTGGVPYVLTRATDYNTVAEINGSGAIPTLNGTVNNNVLWILNTSIAAIGTGQNNISYSVGAATPFPAYTITNASSTGTTLNKLVKLTGAPSTAVRAATTDTTGIIGICLSNCGTSGAALIGFTNTLACVFDGATTAGDFVQISSSTAGDCHDGGSAYPTTGGDILGRVLTTNAAGGTFQMVWGSLDVASKANPIPVNLPTPGSTCTFTSPYTICVCTTTCTVTVPVPAAGYQFCVMNDDNVSTVITLSAIGSSARYENQARAAYGTAGTGTLVSGGSSADAVCIVGRDSTHYLTVSSTGIWTAN